MPSQKRSNRTISIQKPSLKIVTKSPEQLEDVFHDALTQLSANLAIRHGSQPEQEAPCGTLDKISTARQLEDGIEVDFYEEIGVALPDVLWAVSLIFSESRGGRHVVASVLRQQPPHAGSSETRFTLYLTTNNGKWPPDYARYSEKWMYEANDGVQNITLDFSSELWRELTNMCAERIKGYATLAKADVLAVSTNPKRSKASMKEKCTATSQDFDTWEPPGCLMRFSRDLTRLLEDIEGGLNTDLKAKDNLNSLVSLIEKCWEFMEGNGDRFQELYKSSLKNSNLRAPNWYPKFRYPGRARLFLKSIENLARVPRAFFTFAKFRGVIAAQKARLDIKLLPLLLPEPPTFSHGDVPLIQVDYSSVQKYIESRISDKKQERAQSLITKHEDSGLHCEIQLLQYFDHGDKSGIWNVIGCSKRQCLVCAELLRDSDFLFKESHGKAYFQQLLSIEKWLGKKEHRRRAIIRLNTKLVKKAKKPPGHYTEPDSPICQDWSSSKLRNLRQAPTLLWELSHFNVATRPSSPGEIIVKPEES